MIGAAAKTTVKKQPPLTVAQSHVQHCSLVNHGCPGYIVGVLPYSRARSSWLVQRLLRCQQILQIRQKCKMKMEDASV